MHELASKEETSHRSLQDIIISVDGVSLRFGGVAALTDVSLSVARGEIYSIIGPNGAGKTSLLNCINGFYQPTAGRIAFDGVQTSGMSAAGLAEGGLARTFQNLALFKALSTIDNLLLGRNLKMKTNLFQAAFFWGKTREEELQN